MLMLTSKNMKSTWANKKSIIVRKIIKLLKETPFKGSQNKLNNNKPAGPSNNA